MGVGAAKVPKKGVATGTGAGVAQALTDNGNALAAAGGVGIAKSGKKGTSTATGAGVSDA